jgi:hypothetical protein
MKKTYIYSLVCPINNCVKYIGKSNDPKSRFRKHVSLGDKNTGDNILKNEWIRCLLEKNLLPILSILEEVDISEWKEKEKYYIKLYKQKGFELFNICGGGNGPSFGNSGSFKGNPPVEVVCLKKNGEYIGNFNSVKEGRIFCGKRIDAVLSGRKKTAGGYIWIYKKEYENLSCSDLQNIIDNANINNSSKNGEYTRWKIGNQAWNKGKSGFISKKRKKVKQYTMDNVYVKTWDCAKIAALYFYCSTSNIIMCASGRTKTAVGYKWVYED